MSKFSLGHRRSAKLTPEQVFEMRRLYSEENWSQRQLCNHFDISLGQVGRIVRGESWRHYTQIPTDQELEHRMAVAPPLTPEQDAEALAAIARLAEQNAVPPPKSEAEQNRYDLASLVEDLRKRKAEQTLNNLPQPSDPPVGGAVPQVDIEETRTHDDDQD